ncbi:MAG TPA: hypothetical protein VJ782_01560 [Aeromicrobium sp.]|nr:hypothetical protein [Aeromicrobium sp.]
MSWRRLRVLIDGVLRDPFSALSHEVRAAYEKSLKPTAEQVRARQEHYRRKREEAAS